MPKLQLRLLEDYPPTSVPTLQPFDAPPIIFKTITIASTKSFAESSSDTQAEVKYVLSAIGMPQHS